MMVRSPNPNVACPHRHFPAANGALLPNPQPSRSARRPAMTLAGATAMDNLRPAAPTAQTVVITPRSTRPKTISQPPNPHSTRAYQRTA